MSVPSTPLFGMQIVVAATPAKVGATGARKLWRVVLFGGSAASSVEFKNAASDTGSVLFSVNVPIGNTIDIDLTSVGGIPFDTAIFCKPAGTAAICHVWFD